MYSYFTRKKKKPNPKRTKVHNTNNQRPRNYVLRLLHKSLSPKPRIVDPHAAMTSIGPGCVPTMCFVPPPPTTTAQVVALLHHLSAATFSGHFVRAEIYVVPQRLDYHYGTTRHPRGRIWPRPGIPACCSAPGLTIGPCCLCPASPTYAIGIF
jgi:hypothetical protein